MTAIRIGGRLLTVVDWKHRGAVQKGATLTKVELAQMLSVIGHRVRYYRTAGRWRAAV